MNGSAPALGSGAPAGGGGDASELPVWAVLVFSGVLGAGLALIGFLVLTRWPRAHAGPRLPPQPGA